MIKKIYNISGFDCPVCASKVESHLSKNNDIENVRIDFSDNKMYITYKKQAWNLEKLKKIIKEVELNPLNITEYGESLTKENKIFNKKMKIMLGRIIFSVIVILICLFILTKETIQFSYLRAGLYLFATLVIGYDIFYKVLSHIKNKTNILDHNLLISIASIGATVLGFLAIDEEHITMIGNIRIAMDEGMEGVMVIALFQIGQIIESIATNKSKAAVMNAIELRVDRANLVSKEGITPIKPEDIKIGDVVLVKRGELIPIDGEITYGEGLIDTSSLTGEYIPIKANVGEKVCSGCLLKSGLIKIKASKKYIDSTISKIIELISKGGEEKSKADAFISKFAKWYTPIVVLLALLTFLIGLFISNFDFMTWIHTGLEILVIGCPCAIVISVPLAYFSAIGLASRKGIVIKGANYLDKLVNLGSLITDKTGTLTHGSFSIQKVCPNEDISKEELLEYLYAVECLSTHPIGKAICHGLDLRKTASEVEDFNEITSLGVSCIYKSKKILAGGANLLSKKGVKFDEVYEPGSTIYVSVDNVYIGYVVLSDEIKEDAQPMVDLLHSLNIDICLLTGDHEENAKEICTKLGIDRWYSNLLPDQKTDILVSEMSKTDKNIAFIGDGINDAPSITRSDIGIAMGGIGSDIAVNNADMVIMNDDPAKVYDAIKIARIARHTSIFNIIFALAIKFVVFILAIIFKDSDWMMYVAILADTGLTVLLVINSLLVLYRRVNRPKI